MSRVDELQDFGGVGVGEDGVVYSTQHTRQGVAKFATAALAELYKTNTTNTAVVRTRKRRQKEARGGGSPTISHSDKFDSSDTSFDKDEQEYYDDFLVR